MNTYVVRVMRGNHIEALHHASIAVLGVGGELTHSLGDSQMVVMTRSSIKPFQLMPLLTSGAADRFGFDLKQLAIMCGSHNGSDEHRQVVVANLAAAGFTPDDLQCGCHRPMEMELNSRYPEHDEHKDPARHNCSGKHSGFLALSRFIGDDPSAYLDSQSPTQQLVRTALEEYCGVNLPPESCAVDGCSAPNYPLSLSQLADAYRRLAIGEGSDSIEAAHVARIRDAMMAHPEMVSGEKRLDLDLMRSFDGNIICKYGAEAIMAIGFKSENVGIVVKIHDGHPRALGAIIVEILRQLGIINQIGDFPLLNKYERPEVRNVTNKVTGYIDVSFMLRAV
jgi:L-asparaginase II